jgi:hypothetical protein
MLFRSLCAFIWFKNIEKMLLQMTSGFLQLESSIGILRRAISGKIGKYHPGSGEIDRTGLKILENNKNIQSIISVR